MVISYLIILSISPLVLSLNHPQQVITSKVFFDITINDQYQGRIIMGLYGKTLPRTSQNFRGLCTGEFGKNPKGVPLHYKNSLILRTTPAYVLQGGDFVLNEGSGGQSIYAKKFLDQSFNITHNGRGILSMGNSGPNTNTSIFLISLQANAHFDFKYVAFGEVLEGDEVLSAIEKHGSESGQLDAVVKIADSGEIIIK